MIDIQSLDTWKIQLTIAINFISSKDTKEVGVMHSTSNNVKLTSYNDANEVFNKLFEWLRSRYKWNLKTSMRISDFIFDSVQLMYFLYVAVHILIHHKLSGIQNEFQILNCL